MSPAILSQGHANFCDYLNRGIIENRLGGEVEKGKKKTRDWHHWAMKGRKQGMKKPNLMGEYKPIYTLTGERL